MMKHLRTCKKKKEEGQGLVEVGIFLLLVVIGSLVVLPNLGAQLVSIFNQVTSALGG